MGDSGTVRLAHHIPVEGNQAAAYRSGRASGIQVHLQKGRQKKSKAKDSREIDSLQCLCLCIKSSNASSCCTIQVHKVQANKPCVSAPCLDAWLQHSYAVPTVQTHDMQTGSSADNAGHIMHRRCTNHPLLTCVAAPVAVTNASGDRITALLFSGSALPALAAGAVLLPLTGAAVLC